MAVIADDANVSQEGKLNILGVFDRISTQSFPTVHPKMVFAFRVQAEYPDSGRVFPVRMRIMGEDGEAVFEVGGELRSPDVPPGGFATANKVFTLVGIRLPQPGTYKFVLNVGDVVHETPLLVTHHGDV